MRSIYLLDTNVLIALTVAEHEHHQRCSEWLADVREFAICPITEGALVRFLVRMGEPATTAVAILQAIHQHPRCRFWGDTASYTAVDLSHIRGHRQVTDAYLVGLATANDARLTTLDEALAGEYPDRYELVPA